MQRHGRGLNRGYRARTVWAGRPIPVNQMALNLDPVPTRPIGLPGQHRCARRHPRHSPCAQRGAPGAHAVKPAPAAHALTRRLLDGPAPPAPKRSDIPTAHLAALAGLYHAPQADDLLRLTVREGKLPGDGSERVPIGPGHFAHSRGGTTFSFSAETPLRRQVTSRNATADDRAVAVPKPSAADRAVYGGSNRSAELDVVNVLSGRPARSPSASGREPRSQRSPRLPTASCSVEAGMRRLRATPPAGSRATNSPTAAAGA